MAASSRPPLSFHLSNQKKKKKSYLITSDSESGIESLLCLPHLKSKSSSPTHCSRCLNSLCLSVESMPDGFISNRSGLSKKVFTSLVHSSNPALYLSSTSLLRTFWRCKCLTVSSNMSAFSNLECFVLFCSVFAESSIRVFNMARDWLILARRRFSINGLLI